MNIQRPNSSTPRVSIGLPVYNGENYLSEAIESLLAQSYEDFELIITDNASTDRTREICESYAEKDSRIHYIRNASNIGAAANYNLTFDLARGEYFKWAAHDDICASGYLKCCIEALDRDSTIVLCHPKEVAIDETGEVIPGYMDKYYQLKHLQSELPHKRFHDIACRRHLCFQVFGVMRSSALAKTSRIGNYVGSDRVLLAELALRGRYWESPEAIYFRRHSEQYCALSTHEERMGWFDPNKKQNDSLKYVSNFFRYLRVIEGSPLKRIEKLRCHLLMTDWLRKKRHRVFREIASAAKHTLRLG